MALSVEGNAGVYLVPVLADLPETDIVNIGIPDVSALGAACLAGLQAGVFRGYRSPQAPGNE